MEQVLDKERLVINYETPIRRKNHIITERIIFNHQVLERMLFKYFLNFIFMLRSRTSNTTVYTDCLPIHSRSEAS